MINPAIALGSVIVRVIQILIIITSGSLFSGCVLSIGDGDYDVRHERRHLSPPEVAERNRQRLGSLKLGMSPREAVDLMGEATWGSGSSALSNPHKSDAVTLSDGTALEILFYYTEPRKEDGFVGDDEVTPLFFENAELRGWGQLGLQAFLADRVGAQIELPAAALDPLRGHESSWSAVPTAGD